MLILSTMNQPAETEIDFAEETRRFFSIQVSRYLGNRPSDRFSGKPERDAVLAMIKDAWVELRSSDVIAGLSRNGREAVYVTCIIVFPSFVADGGLWCIPVDFSSGCRLGEHLIGVPSRPTLDL
jgi:hypothetical protein